MTRKEALAELIAKVEAGDATNDGSMSRAFGDKWTLCYDAFHGSLDAALALHHAVLPGWGWALTDVGEAHILSADGPIASGESDTPARAWLLAIIKALHEMEENK